MMSHKSINRLRATTTVYRSPASRYDGSVSGFGRVCDVKYTYVYIVPKQSPSHMLMSSAAPKRQTVVYVCQTRCVHTTRVDRVKFLITNIDNMCHHNVRRHPK